MTSMNVIFRPSSKGTRCLGSLSFRLIRFRKVKAVTLSGFRIYPWEWNDNKQSVIYPKNDPVRFSYLAELQAKLYHELNLFSGYIRQLNSQGHYTVDDVVRLYREKRDETYLLGYTEYLACLLEHRGQNRTARAYRTVTRGLVRFNGGEDIPLEQINSRLIQGFEKYLKEKGCVLNTVSYYMRNLRAIYNKAVNSGRVVPIQGELPFSGVYTGVTKTVKRALSLEAVQKLRMLDFTSSSISATLSVRIRWESLFRAWRYFFFCLHARGMSFVDMAYLKKTDISGGVLRYCRKKTGTPIEMGITSELRSLMDSFSGETVGSPYVFPIIGENCKSPVLWYENALRVQNRHLKILAALSGIEERLSTHVARHTWATIGKQKNVPVRVLSDCLGHNSESVTQIYLGLLDNSELDRANAIVSSAILGRPIQSKSGFKF